MLRNLYANFEEYFCVGLCGVTIVCLALQVGIRALFGSALAWTEELSRFCFIWTVYLGMSLATKRLAQVRITAQFCKTSPQTRLFFRMLSDLICVAMNLLIVWFCLDVIREDYAFPEVSPTLGIVKANVELVIPASFLLTTWRVVEMYIQHFRSGTLLALVQDAGEGN